MITIIASIIIAVLILVIIPPEVWGVIIWLAMCITGVIVCMVAIILIKG